MDHPAGLPPLVVALGTFDPRDTDGLHAVVRRFRDGDPDAGAEVIAGAVDAARRMPGLAGRPVALVPVPGHDPGAHTGPRLALARSIGAALGWPVPEPPPLLRLAAVPTARGAAAGRDPAAEAASLAWDDAAVEPGAAIVLLDDVLASGTTLAACAAAVRRDSHGDRAVHALVIAVARPAGADGGS